ncbi:hypothetical protein M0805_008620 [Coniferiporia weirii]|nr:hypothetical protein M0805_008620 [Coniferiporia weirii]
MATASVEVGVQPISHVPRVSHNYPGAGYIFPADEEEVERLMLQHAILKATFEGRVLLIPFNPQSSYFVLDSGVGPGAWLLDAATQFAPTSILHGVDIQNRLFPREHPPNVSFSITSIIALPQEWTGRFDIVHQRLLIAALRRKEWPLALQNMLGVLQPGGWIQLTEIGVWHAGPFTERHSHVVRELYDSHELILDIAIELPELLREAGFVDIRAEGRKIPLGAWAGQLGIDARDDMVGVFRNMKTPLLQSGGLGFVKTEEEFDKSMDALGKEWDETEGALVEFHTFCAQKPTGK